MSPSRYIPRFSVHPRPRIDPSAPPGTLRHDPSAALPRITVIDFNEDQLVEHEVQKVEDLRPLLENEQTVTWVNVDGVQHSETIAALGELLSLHRLALEDVVNVQQRSKVEAYGDHYYIVSRMPVAGDHLTTEQLSLFLGTHVVLTFQERHGDCLDHVRKRIRDSRPKIRTSGTDYLAYAILDAVVDAYFPFLDTNASRLEQLEAKVLEKASNRDLADLHGLKRDLSNLHRVILSLREALRTLIKEETPLVSDETRVYLRDCYDHAFQLLELVDGDREAAASLMDFYMSNVSNRMNEVMKVLTIMASIFIPLTFMAGVYGMNFEHMPELKFAWAYPAVLALMIVIAFIMVLFFRRRGWLWAGKPKS